MFTTLVATLLTFVPMNVAVNGAINSVAVPMTVEEIVTDSTFESYAGPVDAPIPMKGIGMEECKKQAPPIIAHWMSEHPVFHSWTLREWKCVPGRYAIGRRA
jgi:hypothetical protein